MTNFSNISSHTRYDGGESAITLNKSRLKIYSTKNVYLKNQAEFEIELFNPNKYDLIAEVSIQGEDMGSFVVRPGQRIFLERSSLSSKRFKFSHYEADKSNEALNAIQENGNVTVKWHNTFEYNTNTYWSVTPNYISPTILTGTHNIQLYSSNTANFSLNSTNGFLNTSGNTALSSSYTNDSINNTIKTGRVEKGSESNQSFQNSNIQKGWYIKTDSYKILPYDEKIVEANEVRVYCTSCGIKTKNNWKFCPKCGSKIE